METEQRSLVSKPFHLQVFFPWPSITGFCPTMVSWTKGIFSQTGSRIKHKLCRTPKPACCQDQSSEKEQGQTDCLISLNFSKWNSNTNEEQQQQSFWPMGCTPKGNLFSAKCQTSASTPPLHAQQANWNCSPAPLSLWRICKKFSPSSLPVPNLGLLIHPHWSTNHNSILKEGSSKLAPLSIKSDSTRTSGF